MSQRRFSRTVLLHCRAGSLETLHHTIDENTFLHCRAGSLEIEKRIHLLTPSLHCRAGSLGDEWPKRSFAARGSEVMDDRCDQAPWMD